MVWDVIFGFPVIPYILWPVAILYGDTLSSYIPAKSGAIAVSAPANKRAARATVVPNHASNEHAQNEPISGEIYHVTPTHNLDSIFRDGLRPQIGPRSALLGETKEMVYFFGSMLAVEDALSNWLGEALDDEPGAISVLAVDRSGLHLVSDAGYELACLRLVPPENISLAFQDDVPADEKSGPETGGTS